MSPLDAIEDAESAVADAMDTLEDDDVEFERLRDIYVQLCAISARISVRQQAAL